MSDESKLLEKYKQAELFFKESEKVYIEMSDGAQIRCYYTEKEKNSEKLTIVFIHGYATVSLSWGDLWDELYDDYNLICLESRETHTSRVKWKHKGDMHRMGMDIKEMYEYFDLDSTKTFVIAPSFGASRSARAIAAGWIKPAGVVFIGPSTIFKLPRKILWLAYIFPAFFMNIIGRPIIKTWIKLTIPPSLQRMTYLDFIGKASGMRWKKTLPIANWDATVDYKEIQCPVWVVGTAKDNLHEGHVSQYVADIIPEGKLVEVPNYNFMHFKGLGVKKFALIIKEFIEELET